MASDIFAKLGDIKGESLDSKHKDEVEVLSWSWGVNRSDTIGPGGGSSAGKARFNDFNFTHHVDKASPVLLKSCATGEHIKEATITVRKAGKGQQEFLIIKMNDIIITSVAPSGAGDIGHHGGERRASVRQSRPGIQAAEGRRIAGCRHPFQVRHQGATRSGNRSRPFRRSNHQPRNRRSRFHPQLGVPDLRHQSGAGEQPFDIPARVAVAAVQLEAIVRGRVAACAVLESKDQQAARAQGSRSGRDDVLQVAEIDQRVGRDDQVERFLAVRAGTPSTRLSPARRRHSSPAPEPACPRRDRHLSAGEHTGPRADRTAPFRSRHRARRGSLTARAPNLPARPRQVPGRDTTASRASTRSSRRSCRRFLRRTRPTRAAGRRDRCRPPACAAQSGRLAPRRAIPRRSSPPRRSRRSCSAPAPEVVGLPGASASA